MESDISYCHPPNTGANAHYGSRAVRFPLHDNEDANIWNANTKPDDPKNAIAHSIDTATIFGSTFIFQSCTNYDGSAHNATTANTTLFVSGTTIKIAVT